MKTIKEKRGALIAILLLIIPLSNRAAAGENPSGKSGFLGAIGIAAVGTGVLFNHFARQDNKRREGHKLYPASKGKEITVPGTARTNFLFGCKWAGIALFSEAKKHDEYFKANPITYALQEVRNTRPPFSLTTQHWQQILEQEMFRRNAFSNAERSFCEKKALNSALFKEVYYCEPAITHIIQGYASELHVVDNLKRSTLERLATVNLPSDWKIGDPVE